MHDPIIHHRPPSAYARKLGLRLCESTLFGIAPVGDCFEHSSRRLATSAVRIVSSPDKDPPSNAIIASRAQTWVWPLRPAEARTPSGVQQRCSDAMAVA